MYVCVYIYIYIYIYIIVKKAVLRGNKHMGVTVYVALQTQIAELAECTLVQNEKHRESIEVIESTRVVLEDIPQKGWCGVLLTLSLAVLALCVISPLNLPSLHTGLC